MIDENVRRYEQVLGGWKITKQLCRGSSATLYELEKDDGQGRQETSVLKFMHWPQEAMLMSMREKQPDMDVVKQFFAVLVEEELAAIRILQRCRGQETIVRYEDHLVTEHHCEESVGWDILLRMEKLNPIDDYFSGSRATQLDVIHMWRDIATALVYCEKQDIVHRDIKPGHILVSDDGVFKLTGFDAATCGKEFDQQIGTLTYMAPEIYRADMYDKRVAIYSLGMVVYFFLNNCRRPFMPLYPDMVDFRSAETADMLRYSGKKIPAIPHVSARINKILLKSLAYNPRERYRSAEELLVEIQKILDKEEQKLKKKPLHPGGQS